MIPIAILICAVVVLGIVLMARRLAAKEQRDFAARREARLAAAAERARISESGLERLRKIEDENSPVTGSGAGRVRSVGPNDIHFGGSHTIN